MIEGMETDQSIVEKSQSWANSKLTQLKIIDKSRKNKPVILRFEIDESNRLKFYQLLSDYLTFVSNFSNLKVFEGCDFDTNEPSILFVEIKGNQEQICNAFNEREIRLFYQNFKK